MPWLSRIANTLRTERLDEDLYEELQFHLDQRIDELVRRGHTSEEAEREARRHFGNPGRLVEQSRDAKLSHGFQTLVRDVKFGLRLLRHQPWPTAAVLLSLSLAMGAAATAFSLIDSLLFRALPVPEAHKLFVLSYTGPGQGGGTFSGENINFSMPLLERMQAAVPEVELFGVTYGGPRQSIQFAPADSPAPVRPQWISGTGWRALALTPSLGRFFTAGEDWTEGESAAVISHRYWQDKLQGDRTILDRRFYLTIRGVPHGVYRIVGVAPPSFEGVEPGAPADVWLPLATRVGHTLSARPEAVYYQIRGRVTGPNPNWNAMQQTFQAFRSEHEKTLLRPGQDAQAFRSAQLIARPATATPSYTRSQYEQPFWIAAGVVVLVLLAACSNIANLLIARSAAREEELRIRMAVGASRGRLIRQLLVESCVLSAASCVGALAVAMLAGPAIVRYLGPADFPVYLNLRPDLRLLFFLLSTGILVTTGFGLFPAFRASGIDPRPTRATPSFAVMPLRPLLAAQVAFGFAVLYVAGLLVGGFRNSAHMDLGYDARNISVWTVASPRGPTHMPAFLAAVRRWPGVEAVAASSCTLAEAFAASAPVFAPTPQGPVRVAHMGVSPGFFHTMGISLRQGRDIRFDDAAELDPPNVIVNEAFARKFFPSGTALGGKYLRRSRDRRISQTIVGIVPDARYIHYRPTDEPVVFVPRAELDQSAISIRGGAGADPADWEARLRKELPGMRLAGTTNYDALLTDRTRRERLMAWVAGFLAALSTAVVLLGLHGVAGYALARRRQEIGLRLAVGAPPARVAWEMLRSSAGVSGVGLAAGAAISLAVTPWIVPVLYGPIPLTECMAIPAASLVAAWILTALPAVARLVRTQPSATLLGR